MVATPETALAKTAQAAEAAGIAPVLLGTDWQQEAREVARLQARLICEAAHQSERPIVFLSGGETTVTVRGPGRGGRNTEYLLALALALRESACPRFTAALAADTDGFDGTEENAGAYLFPDSIERAAKLGLDPRHLLLQNDSHRFFARLGDLLVTGPTRTNVNDLRALLLL